MHQIEHFELATAHPVTLKLGAGCVIRVTHGRLWVTRPNHFEDVWLHAGESWTLPASGAVWISAESAAKFQLAHSLSGWRWTRMTSLRQYLPRLHSPSLRARGWEPIAGSQWQAG